MALSVSQQIIRRHFSAKTLRSLEKRGIRVLSSTFIPGSDGSYCNGETAYNVDDNGCGRVWTFLEIMREAA